MFGLFSLFSSLDFDMVFTAAAADPGKYAPALTLVCLCLFLGAVGKSAQVPLFVWLPDAMAGPTPVSALIHAATMVTAGVYMVARCNVLFRLAPEAMAVVAVVGAVTAIFAGIIAVAQNDIKKVLAYSTVSQLGYMFWRAASGRTSPACFTSDPRVLQGLPLPRVRLGHPRDGGRAGHAKMGGLKSRLPITYWTFLVATLAIAGSRRSRASSRRTRSSPASSSRAIRPLGSRALHGR
jgi:NADH-quinone oxidoreductase subunit L